MRRSSTPPRFARLTALTLAAALTASSTASAQDLATPCVTADEAQGLLLAVAPDLFQAVATTCAARLPAGALLRQQRGAFIDKYRAAADGAWDQGKAALGKLVGGQAAGLMDSDYARPLLSGLVTALVVKQIKPDRCVAIDRLLTLMAPLPPRNTAGVVVTLVQLDNADRLARGRKPDLPLCPASAAADRP